MERNAFAPSARALDRTPATRRWSRFRRVLVAALAGALVLFGGLSCARARRMPSPRPPSAPAPAPVPTPTPGPVPNPVPTPAPARAEEAPVDYSPLQKQIADYLATKQGTYGVFFKDLPSGRSFGINDTVPIPAASTVKVPIVLYINQLAAEGKLDWNEKVVYSSQTDYREGAGILHMVATDGDKYSIRVLSNLAITVSDNVATAILIRRLGLERINDFMRSIGGKTVYPEGQNITTAADMGTYVQAVLDFAPKRPDLGGRLLDDLAHTVYNVGLPGQLPPNTVVPHKEGDLPDMAGDIGVVYSSRPYILVVLAKDISNPDRVFAEDIARTSKMAYDFQEHLAAGQR